jgi:hypothetical protein
VLDAAREAPETEVERNIADDVRSSIDLFRRFGVSLIPGATTVPADKPAEARPNESLEAVIADIVIETLGLGDVQDMLLFLFDRYDDSPGPLVDIAAGHPCGRLSPRGRVPAGIGAACACG